MAHKKQLLISGLIFSPTTHDIVHLIGYPERNYRKRGRLRDLLREALQLLQRAQLLRLPPSLRRLPALILGQVLLVVGQPGGVHARPKAHRKRIAERDLRTLLDAPNLREDDRSHEAGVDYPDERLQRRDEAYERAGGVAALVVFGAQGRVSAACGRIKGKR